MKLTFSIQDRSIFFIKLQQYLLILTIASLTSCGSISNGEIWKINQYEDVTVEGHSDSTYAAAKRKKSSPLDQVNPAKFVLSGTIFLYQELLSSQDGNSCQFRPSCSHFGAEAIKEHQFLGVVMTADRLLRCNPYAHTTYNPIKKSIYLHDPITQDDTVTQDNPVKENDHVNKDDDTTNSEGKK